MIDEHMGDERDRQHKRSLATDETAHFMNCRACGQSFDMRELADVMYHEERGHQPKARQ